MTAWANVSGEPITTGTLTIPYFGTWSADVAISSPNEVPNACVLAVGALSLVGFVDRTAPFAGSRNIRLAGGYGGWRKPLGARAYGSSVGVMLSTVLGDAAIEVGEKIVIDTDRELGSAFVRSEGPASRLLRSVASLWWIAQDGTTRLAERDASAIKSAFQVIEFDGGKGRFSIATETPQDWMPGRTFSSATVPSSVRIASVTHHLGNSGTARMEVLTT